MIEFRVVYFNQETEEKGFELVLARSEVDASNKVRNRFDQKDIPITIERVFARVG